ncbi:MAG: carbon monoxide dehydrogenase subunit G [Alphaproteobacteria bacterium]
MEFTGEYRIPAPRERVWAALNDPDVLKQAIPGCQELAKASDTEYTAKVVSKVGPMKATFSGKVTLSDLDPPNSYRIEGEGQGGAAGFAKGGAKVELEAEGEDTVLRYVADAQVGGKLAQLGSRLIDSTARKLADDFFRAFGELVAAEVGAPAAEVVGAPAARPAARGVGTAVWVIGVLVIVALLLLLFGMW